MCAANALKFAHDLRAAGHIVWQHNSLIINTTHFCQTISTWTGALIRTGEFL
jgi:hypothetical protein